MRLCSAHDYCYVPGCQGARSPQPPQTPPVAKTLGTGDGRGSGRHAATTLHPASISLRLAWGRLMLGIAPKRDPKGVKASQRTERKARILIIVQNLPVPFDRRVWLECGALVSAGYQVAVVCPKGRNDPSFEVVDSVEIYKYRPYAPGGSKAGFIAEYIYSFLATALHVVKARRSGRFAVIRHATRRTSSGPSRCSFASSIEAGSSSTTTTCAPSFTCPVSRRAAVALPRAARPGAQDPPNSGSCDLH